MGILTRGRAARLAALATAPRSLPISFAIVGVQKAGTTTLYSMLSEHPQIAAGPQKELRFFIEPRDWADPDYSTYRRPREAAAPERWPATPPRRTSSSPARSSGCAHYDPDLRLLASFRDPLERAFSQWSMERPAMPATPTCRGHRAVG